MDKGHHTTAISLWLYLKFSLGRIKMIIIQTRYSHFTYQIKPWEKIYKAITFFGKIFQLANSNEKTTMLLVQEGEPRYLAFTWDLA
jgi:hypothetical protein